ncbi:hypothetical protein SO694_00028134 [Aureococcus anophagefferens]|uniref:Uncharacterized protein n=1 Tax=Aureococcus anophagefferens TaxID=44056 RepID=A0ABR1FVH3_AURAN
MPREPDIPRAYHNGVDMLDTRNWSDSAFEHGPPLPQPDFSGLLRAGKRLPAIGPMDTWGTRMYEVHYPHEPPKGNMWIVDGLPKPYKHGRTPRQLFEDTFDDYGNFKPQYPDYFEPGNAVRLRADHSLVGMVGWVRWTYGENDDDPEDVSLETLDHFLRRYHIMGWVRMSNGEVHRVDREECEACELPDDVLAECKEFIENNLAFNQDMMYRAKHGDDYQAEFDRKDAYDLERERYRRSGEQDPEAEKDRAEYERKNPLPGNLPKDFFHQFEPDYDPEKTGEVPDHELPGRVRLDHSKHDGTWQFRKDVDTKADLLTGQRPHVQYW